MRPLRYSINVTLDGCCDHQEMLADEELHRHAAENIARADALLFGRVVYQMMEAAWRLSTPAVSMPEWTEPFARRDLTLVDRLEFASGAVVMRYQPRR